MCNGYFQRYHWLPCSYKFSNQKKRYLNRQSLRFKYVIILSIFKALRSYIYIYMLAIAGQKTAPNWHFLGNPLVSQG